MSDGWTQVRGRRGFRPRKNRDGPAECAAARDEADDEARVEPSFGRIRAEINGVYAGEAAFLSRLLGRLAARLPRGEFVIYALGCGSAENSTLELARSCRFQWSVCVIVAKALGARAVWIFDPLMSAADYAVWRRLVEADYDLRNPAVSLGAESQPEPPGPGCDSAHVLLWMPHCERFLYSAVLEGVRANRSPLAVATALAGGPGPPESDRDCALAFSPATTTLVGNSLAEFGPGELGLLAEFRAFEERLPAFGAHPRAFNDTFVTAFARRG